MTWRPSKSLRECSGINRRNTVSCFVIHKYGNGKQRLLVPADPRASSQITQSQRVHTKERRTHIVVPLREGGDRFGIVSDVVSAIGDGRRVQKVRLEEAGFDDRGADAERLHLLD